MPRERERRGFDQQVGDGGMRGPVLFELIAEPLCLLHIDLDCQIKVRHRPFALGCRSGDGFPHLAQRLVCSGWLNLRWRRLGVYNIFFYNSSAGTGSRDSGEIDPSVGSKGFRTGRGDDTGFL
jgi:hypothetical protein